jgi:hypothetical protein
MLEAPDQLTNEMNLLGDSLELPSIAWKKMSFCILSEAGFILTSKSVWAITDAEKRGEQGATSTPSSTTTFKD